MQRTTEDQPRSIRSTLISTLEDLDSADDLAVVSHTHQHMQERTSRLSTFAHQVGLKISQKKTEVVMLNVQHPAPVKKNGEDLPTTEEFQLLRQHCQTWWQSGQRHQESPQQGQKRLQNDEQCLEVIPVQHQDQTKTVPEQCAFHPTVRIGVLEDDGV